MINFNVSVIVPVYKAERYVRDAVESALTARFVTEVILIEDGSTDNSLAICKELKNQYSTVKLLQHKDNNNRGVSSSRNLGIKASSNDFIAFLDADDLYKPDRFENDKIVFETNEKIDGVFSSTINFYESKAVEEQFNAGEHEHFMCIKYTQSGFPLFEGLVWNTIGQFHISAITLKKKVFEHSGLFDEELRLGEDTHLWIRLAAVSYLAPSGSNAPVSLRRIHDTNHIHLGKDEFDKQRRQIYKKLILWLTRLDVSHNHWNTYFEMLNAQTRLFPTPLPSVFFLIKLVLIQPWLLSRLRVYHKLFQLTKLALTRKRLAR